MNRIERFDCRWMDSDPRPAMNLLEKEMKRERNAEIFWKLVAWAGIAVYCWIFWYGVARAL